MKLPPLPKKYNRKEADITGDVMRWFIKNHRDSCAIEVKIKGNKPLPHQEKALKQVHTGVFAYKIPDTGKITPFDFFMLKNAEAFVVTCDGRNCEAKDPDGMGFTFKI